MAFFLFCAAALAQDAKTVQDVDLSGLATFTRVAEKTYPVQETAELFVAHAFGALRVRAWDQNVVRVTARISVWAENAVQAERFAKQIEVAGNHVGDRVEVRTEYPEVAVPSKIGYEADLEISVPRSAALVLENTFGDVIVAGTAGSLGLDARYGIVELSDLAGEVRVRARGEFPLRAARLDRGGSFFLRSTQAHFRNVSGTLHVNNYLGSVEIRSPGPQVDMDVSSENGPIHLYLPAKSAPRLEALVDFGEIDSDVLLQSETWGETTQARLENADAAQDIDLYASFDSIYIHKREAQPVIEPLDPQVGEPIKEVVEHRFDVASGTVLTIEAMEGNVRIEGGDVEHLEVIATQLVRVAEIENARMALEGLAVRVEETPGRLTVRTSVQDDMEALGCSDYRVDLTIRCPHATLINLEASSGQTFLLNIGSPIVIDQASGDVRVENIGGSVQVSSRSGDIAAISVAGPATLQTGNGTVTVREVAGSLSITNDQGKTIIESAGANVTSRNRGGDVRIMALEGIHGDFDVAVENGNISLAMPRTADAWLVLNATGGTVYSTVPVTGSSERDVHAYQGKLNAGTHRVLLETHQGSILID